MKITPALLVAAVGCEAGLAERFAGYLDAACAHYRIDTPQRLAAFLAQIGHESGSFAWVRELATGDAYEGRASLGNSQPGDGRRFRGRGLIQITGRSNYRETTGRLQPLGAPDFTAEPDALEQPRWAAWSAADWWAAHHCNELADAGQFDAITARINGGQNGQADRRARWERAQAALATYVPPAAEKPPVADPALSGAATEWDLQNPAPVVAPATERTPMAPIAADLVLGLARSLFSAFTPLAEEKLTKELGRHTKNPEIAQQVAQAAIASVQAATGKPDPVDAVVAARADPAIMAKVERDVMAELERLAPLMERMAKLDLEQFSAEEASREAAERRAQAAAHDQDPYLTRAIVRLMVGLLVGLCVVWVVLGYLEAETGPLSGTILALAGLIGSKFSTRFDHRYGSSAGSANKDAVRDHVLLSRRQP